MRRVWSGFVLAAVLAVISSPASAEVYNFYCITFNNPNCNNLGAQLTVTVTDASDGGGNKVAFKFENNVGLQSSITDVYFDDGTLLGIATITSSAGVNFDDPATPGDLPGGNNVDPAFETTAGFSADADSPAPSNGVNAAGEWLTVTFNLINGKTFADTIAAINQGFSGAGVGSLRIGMHVQAQAGGFSDGFINTPEPGFYGVLALGMGGLLMLVRRKRANS